MTPRRAGPAPDWQSVCWEAMQDDASLARVLAGFGFSRHHFNAPRGLIQCWRPAYAGCPATSPHRATIAESNRTRRDAEVHFVSDDATLFMVEAHPPGPWRTASAAQRGEDLISLGMLRWSCTFGQAANRIARLVGMRSIPTVPHAR